MPAPIDFFGETIPAQDLLDAMEDAHDDTLKLAATGGVLSGGGAPVTPVTTLHAEALLARDDAQAAAANVLSAVGSAYIQEAELVLAPPSQVRVGIQGYGLGYYVDGDTAGLPTVIDRVTVTLAPRSGTAITQLRVRLRRGSGGSGTLLADKTVTVSVASGATTAVAVDLGVDVLTLGGMTLYWYTDAENEYPCATGGPETALLYSRTSGLVGQANPETFVGGGFGVTVPAMTLSKGRLAPRLGPDLAGDVEARIADATVAVGDDIQAVQDDLDARVPVGSLTTVFQSTGGYVAGAPTGAYFSFHGWGQYVPSATVGLPPTVRGATVPIAPTSATATRLRLRVRQGSGKAGTLLADVMVPISVASGTTRLVTVDLGADVSTASGLTLFWYCDVQFGFATVAGGATAPLIYGGSAGSLDAGDPDGPMNLGGQDSTSGAISLLTGASVPALGPTVDVSGAIRSAIASSLDAYQLRAPSSLTVAQGSSTSLLYYLGLGHMPRLSDLWIEAGGGACAGRDGALALGASTTGAFDLTLSAWPSPADRMLGQDAAWTGATSLRVVASSAASGTKRVLLIGDSIMGRGTNADWLLNTLSDATTISYVGTLGSSPPRLHEGREGWTVQMFNQAGSPFWNGSAFSASYYYTNTGQAAADVVVIALGTNDLGTDPAAAFAKIDQWIASFKAHSASVRIVVAGIYAYGITARYPSPLAASAPEARRAAWEVAEAAWFGGRTSDQVYYAPLSPLVNPSSYPATDYVHPASAGYTETGAALRAAIRYAASA